MKKSEIRKRDKAWAASIKELAGGKCECCCSTPQYGNVHHLVSSRYYIYRWLPLNGVFLCVKCHRFGVHAWHSNPVYVLEKLRKNKGQKWYNAVLEMVGISNGRGKENQ